MKYIIGTRGSRLALAQAEYVRGRLAEAYPSEEFEIRIIKTKGDIVLDKPIHEIGDKGIFVKEIEEKIRDGEVHIGVHSMKDMPSCPASGLRFTRAWKREDPRDVLILREKKTLEELPEGAVIGTGSRRREFQIKRLRPDLKVVNIRGNVDTRIRKMEEERLDGIILAAAGLHRLGMKERITCYLEAEEMISAPAQGVLALFRVRKILCRREFANGNHIFRAVRGRIRPRTPYRRRYFGEYVCGVLDDARDPRRFHVPLFHRLAERRHAPERGDEGCVPQRKGANQHQSQQRVHAERNGVV